MKIIMQPTFAGIMLEIGQETGWLDARMLTSTANFGTNEAARGAVYEFPKHRRSSAPSLTLEMKSEPIPQSREGRDTQDPR